MPQDRAEEQVRRGAQTVRPPPQTRPSHFLHPRTPFSHPFLSFTHPLTHPYIPLKQTHPLTRTHPSYTSPPRCDQDPHVIVAVARLFERDRKIPKAKKWFDRAVALNPKLGDAWAHYYAFELRQTVAASSGQAGDTAVETSASSSSSGADSSSSSAAEVVKRCVLAEPNRGELWCAVAKSTAYRRADVATVLKRVVERMYSAETDGQGPGQTQGQTVPMTE